MSDLPVYDAVLLPGADVNARSVRMSEWCTELAPTEFVLRADGLYPHISLYMANFASAQLGAVLEELGQVSERTSEIPLEADRFAGNDQGMFELFYRKTEAITRLQEEIIAGLDPLRVGLRERDPVGRVLADHRLVAPPVARANLDRHGYDEIGELFRPHITVTRFQRRDQRVPPDLLPPAESFDEVYRTLALCVMGEHGTCTEVVETFELASPVRDRQP
ncbi:hypothetical protein J2853_004065 [Streptosporangium lutulentum]|uniref:2'-5' RNA ligase superfamily protein n=2 Tax=Streptosporangium lutulentum TaxID=1461250 RepID=A0ABT9QFY5_9ACTN|nr:hypothetical protein [Streptosporangium lutulentum]MDP9844854.1 hypothetical protein [Streptosporangium lutulentum]